MSRNPPSHIRAVSQAVSNHGFPEKLAPLFTFGKWRVKVLYGGRGGAKSWGVARALLLIGTMRPVRVLCAREVQDSIKQSVHQLLKDQIQRSPNEPSEPGLGLTGHYDVLNDEIRGRNGTLFLFKGLSAETADSIKSFEGVDICWVEEGHSITKESWEKLTPTIRRANSEIWITLNPALDTDETWVRYCEYASPDVLRIEINWRDNPWFPAVLEKERVSDQIRLPKRDYDNKWEGKPRRVAEGAIYELEIEQVYEQGRVMPIRYDPMLPVHTVWDLGWNDKMAISFVQRSPMEFRVLDYLQESGQRLDWYVDKIQTIARDWRRGYDFLPHDAASGNYLTGKSTEEHAIELGCNPIVLERLDIEEGIKAARLAFPRTVFNRQPINPDDPGRGVGVLLECLRRYKRSINKRTQEPGAPDHDKFSHGADNFRYIAMAGDLMHSGALSQDAVSSLINRDRRPVTARR